MFTLLFIVQLAYTVFCYYIVDGQLNTRCKIPSAYHGDYYTQEGGADVITNVAFDKWSRISVPQEELECIQNYTHPQQASIIGGLNSSMVNTTMLMAVV